MLFRQNGVRFTAHVNPGPLRLPKIRRKEGAFGILRVHVVDGQAVVVGPEDGSKMMVVLVLQMDAAATASKISDLFGKLSRAKEERMREGAIRIVKADREPLRTVGGASTELTRMTIQSGPQTIRSSSLIAASGAWVIEVLHSNLEASDEDIAAILKQILEFLKSGK